MRRWPVVLAAMLFASALPAVAAPLDATLQQQLLALYDSYNKAIAAGKLPEATALRSAEVRVQMQKEMKSAKDKREMMATAKMMVPDSVEVLHAAVNAAGDKAHIITVAAKTIPKDQKIPGGAAPGSTVRSGMTLDFLKEGGTWKFDNQTFGADPATFTACRNYQNEPDTAYDQDKNVAMGGPIIRVDFQPSHTLIVVRVVDEENCAFLPNREELVKHGLEPAKLVPYAIVEIEGSPHKSDKQKILVESLNVQPEE